MAEEWYYAIDGKQAGPVSGAEMKRLAATGIIKPTDLLWKDGMSQWARASSVRALFADDQPSAANGTPFKGPEQPAAPDDMPDYAPARARRREPDLHDDDDPYEEEQRRRRRRRVGQTQGMSTGLKIGLIVGGSMFGILLLVVIIVAATRTARINQPIVFAPPPKIRFNNGFNNRFPPIIVEQAPLVNRSHAAVTRGPLTVGGQEIVIKDRLNVADPRDFVKGLPCKVFTVNLKEGVPYIVRMDSFQLDSFLRLEDDANNELAQDDDSGGDMNSLLFYRPLKTGVYRIIATSCEGGGGQIGEFTLRIAEQK